MLQNSCSIAFLVPHTYEILALLTQEALGPNGPRASCVNSANISHVALEAMLQLLINVCCITYCDPSAHKMVRDLVMNTSEEKSVGCHLTQAIPDPLGFRDKQWSSRANLKANLFARKHNIVLSAFCNSIT